MPADAHTPPSKRLCLVTGASSGIGAAHARAFAERGWDLALTARREDRLRALAEDLETRHGTHSLVLPADLADPETPQRLFDAITDQGRVVDGLVNNGGFGLRGGYAGTDWADQARFLQIMVTAPCALAHHAFKGMMARGFGRIINVASVAGLAPGMSDQTLYSGAKALLIKLSESLMAEARGDVHVTALCPGLTRTEFFEASGWEAALLEGAPEALWQTAEDVARVGLRAVERGDAVVVSGAANKALTFVARMSPPAAARGLARRAAQRYRRAAERRAGEEQA